MVIFEVLSDEVPFVYYSTHLVTQKITGGEQPKRPERTWFTDDLWGMLQLSWSSQSINRPTIKAVFKCLEQMSPAWEPLPPGVRNMEIGADGESSSTARGVPTILAMGRGDINEDANRGK